MLIADSGATKTDWRFIDKNAKVYSISTAGLSPLFWSGKEIAGEIKRKFPKTLLALVKQYKSPIYFYGTSCSSKQRIKIIADGLHGVFPKSKTIINHDILASARALHKKEKGIACILGTGSNSCLYDGKKIIKIIGGLAYILGDEGSGAHIGKEFIKSFLNNELPLPIHQAFIKKYRLDKNDIIDAVYNKKHPNRFLASFAKFIHEHLDNLFIESLVTKSIEDFFEKTVCKYNGYKNIPVGFVGSIAQHFNSILHTVAKSKEVSISKIISHPIDELVNYHTHK